MPGNTLPLGNWDPWGLNQVPKKVVHKYRESEIKHGRLAMLSTLGCIMQEWSHPLHPEVGGLAVTHMDQLLQADSFLQDQISELYPALELQGVDFFLVVSFLCLFEVFALFKNWDRWLPNEYNNQFDHNIGVGNLKVVRIYNRSCDMKKKFKCLYSSLNIKELCKWRLWL